MPGSGPAPGSTEPGRSGSWDALRRPRSGELEQGLERSSRARTASSRITAASSWRGSSSGNSVMQQLGEAEYPRQRVVDLVGHGRRQLADRTELRGLDELLLDALDLDQLAPHAGQQRVVLHGDADLAGHELGQIDETRIEDSLAERIEQVQPAQRAGRGGPRAGSPGPPRSRTRRRPGAPADGRTDGVAARR